YVRQRMRHVARASRSSLHSRFDIQDMRDLTDQSVEIEPRPAADIEDLAAHVRRGQSEQIGPNHIVYVGEISRLRTIPVERTGRPVEHCRDKPWNDGCVM